MLGLCLRLNMRPTVITIIEILNHIERACGVILADVQADLELRPKARAIRRTSSVDQSADGNAI